jgi:transcriptional regulator with XRE-family HTH domain
MFSLVNISFPDSNGGGKLCQAVFVFSLATSDGIILVKGGENVADDQTVGQRIKHRREELGLSLSQLAEKAGVAKSYLWELENDAAKAPRPSGETLFKLAEALGTTVADLLGRPVHRKNASRIPETLRAFAQQENLTEGDLRMLAVIEYRGERPDTVEDWRYIYESIKRTILGKAKQ